MVRLIHVILLFVLVDINGIYVHGRDKVENDDAMKDLQDIAQRKKTKKHRSTSSSSGSGDEKIKSDKSSNRKESLEVSDTSSSSSGGKNKKDIKKKSSKERRGWRKWHRKCTPCPEDMRLKWRDPRVKWICGSYQLARRSFKSLCMMHYRNCQDGTMFVKMADHRCKNGTELVDQGQHFFYDYSVVLSDESSKDRNSKSTSDESSISRKTSSSESWDTEKYGPKNMNSEDFRNHINLLHN